MLPERKINGKKVARLREALEMSQQALGDAVGLQQAGVNTVEKEYKSPAGVYRSTSVEKFIRMAEVLGTNMHYLADDIDDPRPIKDILRELEQTKNRGIVIVPHDPEQGEILKACLPAAQQLPNQELRWLAILITRLAQTSTLPTSHEAVDAAKIIDKLPPQQRSEALAAVQDIEHDAHSTVDELRDRMNYLLELVKDIAGADARTEIERRFNVHNLPIKE